MPKLVLLSDPSVEIIGTLEVIHGISPVVADPDGAWSHGGGTDVDWNSQRTKRFRSGRDIFIASNGQQVSARKIAVLTDDGRTVALGRKVP